MPELQTLLREDLPAMVGLVSVCADEWSDACCFEMSDADLLRHTFDDPDYEEELLVGARHGVQLVGIGYGVRRAWKKGREQDGYVKILYVAPEARRRGIGTALLTCMEEGLERRGARTMNYGGCAPRYLVPGVAEDDAATRGLLASRGWQAGSRRINLEGTLGAESASRHQAAAASLMRPGTVAEVAGESNEAATRRFIEREFSASWAIEAERGLAGGGDPFCSVLREQDGAVLGFAAMNTTNPNWFGPMGVRADVRGRGLGAWLVHHALAEAATRGTHRYLLPWVNDNAVFYRHVLGSLQERGYLKMKKKL